VDCPFRRIKDEEGIFEPCPKSRREASTDQAPSQPSAVASVRANATTNRLEGEGYSQRQAANPQTSVGLAKSQRTVGPMFERHASGSPSALAIQLPQNVACEAAA